MTRPLSPLRQRFVVEYLVDGCGAHAAVRAGYSPNESSSTAGRLLRDPTVAMAVQRAQDKRAYRTEVTADQVLTELARVAFASVHDFMRETDDGKLVLDVEHLDPDVASTIKKIKTHVDANGGVTTEVELWDKMGALRDIARHLGMFSEEGGVTINVGPVPAYSDTERFQRFLWLATGGGTRSIGSGAAGPDAIVDAHDGREEPVGADAPAASPGEPG